ncbi:hypothetical protein [Flavobacterium sp. HBTb2-11-1]|uniref:hypothetical protein n=1 Tax=Flavobacterium sp. HBTb2-11-1 TaxID=2692212 RepID=UPI00136FBABE|nr:hypothetical protein [Flavobacterium sp. HBTb2-11-1]MXO06172.1 hypothetical protein [Flavobacterium sp. HBTb2-11-1]
MKNIFLYALLFCSVFCFSQNYTERYNEGLERYEYFNNGVMIGYKTYQSYNQTWKYTDLTAQPNPYTNKSLDYGKTINTQDVDLQGRTATLKQQKYNTNKEKIQNYMDHIYDGLQDKLPRETLNTMKSRLYNEVCLKLPRLDFSIDSNTNYACQMILDGAYKIRNEEIDKLASLINDPKETIAIDYIVEYSFINNDWKTVNYDTTGGEVTFEDNHILFKRGSAWKDRKLTLKYFNTKEKMYIYDSEFGEVHTDETVISGSNISKIIFYDKDKSNKYCYFLKH